MVRSITKLHEYENGQVKLIVFENSHIKKEDLMAYCHRSSFCDYFILSAY